MKRITGIYSNLSYNKEGGDLLSMELLIVPRGHGQEPAYSVFVQIAEGDAPFSVVVPLKLWVLKLVHSSTRRRYSSEHLVGTFKVIELVVR